MKRSALFVGVNRYNDPGINPLKYAENDAIELHGFFKYSAGYEDVRLLSNPHSQVVLDTVGEMLAGLGKGDLFLFFFAGHGVEHEKRHLLLCPRVRYGRLRYFQETVPVDLVEDETRKPGLNRLFILDACRTDLLAGGRSVSGEGLQGTAGLRDIVAAREPEVDTGGFALLCSCGEGQQAREIDELQHGIFADAFLSTCKEGLKRGNGLAVSDDLIVSLQTRIDETGGRSGAGQRPWIKKCGVLPPLIGSVFVQEPPKTPQPPSHEQEKQTAELKGNLQDGGVARLAAERKKQEEERRTAETEAACAKADAEKAKVEAQAKAAQSAAEKKQRDALCTENLARWIAAGKPGEWVREHSGKWHHIDWLDLLSSLLHSKFWPMDERAIGSTLETEKQKLLEEARKARVEVEEARARADAVKARIEAQAKIDRLAAEVKRQEEVRRAEEAEAARARAERAVIAKVEAAAARLAAERKQQEEARHAAEAEAARARSEQEELAKLKPTVKLLAVVGGKEVSGAKVSDGKNTWDTPIVLSLVRGGNYAFKISYKDSAGNEYRGECNIVPDWTSERVERINLTRANMSTGGSSLPPSKPAVPMVPKNLPPSQDESEEVKWYRKAAEQGDAAAQYNLGVCYDNGTGVAKDEAEAVRWYRKAAEQGYAAAQNNLGVCYLNGTGVAKDEVEKVKWYRKAAEQGYAAAQFNLGVCYLNGRGVAKDEVEKVKWYRKAAEQGYAAAQYNLGVCYDNGTGVAKDEAEAVAWYRKAAEQGYAGGQNNLGVCYDNGRGVAKDEAEAVRWYRKAAEQGYAAAQNNLGVCYLNGTGVAKDEVEKVKWYRKAAEQGYAAAQFNLGVCYLNGRGVAKDEAEAVRWYRKAAEQGYAAAQNNLGVCYRDGRGVAKNETEAAKWFRKAGYDKKGIRG